MPKVMHVNKSQQDLITMENTTTALQGLEVGDTVALYVCGDAAWEIRCGPLQNPLAAVLAAAQNVPSRLEVMEDLLLILLSLSLSLDSGFSMFPTEFCRSVSSASATVESLMQLHSAIASVRFRSFIAVDSSSWSWLSQDNDFISKLQNLILLDKGHGFTSNACI